MVGDRSSPVRGLGAAHDERRGSILDAVFTLVDTEGMDHVSIRHVAHTAGVSVGRVQHYFPTKDDLLAAAFTVINERGTRRVHEQLAEADVADAPEHVINAVLTTLIPHTSEERRLVRVAQAFEAYALTRDHLSDHVTRGYDELARLLALLLRTSITPETAEDADASSPAFLPQAQELLALTTGLTGLVITDNLTPDQAHHLAVARLEETLHSLCASPMS